MTTQADGAAPMPFFMRSARLGFGVWRGEDLVGATAIWGDALVTRLTGGPFDTAQVRGRLALEVANHAAHGVQYWPIFRLESGRLAGCCGLRPRPGEPGIFEIGYALRHEAWGNRFAEEAARRVVEWAGSHGIPALIAGHHPENEASRRILVALGFAYTHHELYEPSGQMEPCYRLPLQAGPDGQRGPFR